MRKKIQNTDHLCVKADKTISCDFVKTISNDLEMMRFYSVTLLVDDKALQGDTPGMYEIA